MVARFTELLFQVQWQPRRRRTHRSPFLESLVCPLPRKHLKALGAVPFVVSSIFTILLAPSYSQVEIDIPDPGLEAAIRDAVRNASATLLDTQLHSLQSLNASSRNITNLAGIEYCENMIHLDLSNNSNLQIGPISNLRQLEWLDLSSSNITDLSPIASLSELREVHVSDNYISDLSPLSHLTHLVSLDLSANGANLANSSGCWPYCPEFIDLTPISILTELTVLRLDSNYLSDINPISTLHELRELYLADNFISDTSALSQVTQLHTLDLSGNALSYLGLTPIASLTDLRVLRLDRNYLSDDISPLANPLANLLNLKELYLADSHITDLNPLSNLTQLVILDVSDNWGGPYIASCYPNCGGVSDLTPLSTLTSLSVLLLDRNYVNDLSPLSNLTDLTVLSVDLNVIDDLSPIARLTNLVFLSAFGRSGLCGTSGTGSCTNTIMDLGPLSNLTKLRELHLDYLRIYDVEPLRGLTNLRTLTLSAFVYDGPPGGFPFRGSNAISDIGPLADLPALEYIALNGNPLNWLSNCYYVPTLLARGVNGLGAGWTPCECLFELSRDWYREHADSPEVEALLQFVSNRKSLTSSISRVTTEGMDN